MRLQFIRKTKRNIYKVCNTLCYMTKWIKFKVSDDEYKNMNALKETRQGTWRSMFFEMIALYILVFSNKKISKLVKKKLYK